MGQLRHATLERRKIVVVLRQLTSDAVGDLLQIIDDSPGPLELAARGVGLRAALAPLIATDQVTDDGNSGKRHLSGQTGKVRFHGQFHERNAEWAAEAVAPRTLTLSVASLQDVSSCCV